MIAVLAGAVLGPFTAVYAVGPVAAVLFLPLLAVQLGVTLGLGVVPGSFTIPDKVTAGLTAGLLSLYFLLLMHTTLWNKLEAYFCNTPWLRHTGELQAVEGTRKYATRCPFTGHRPTMRCPSCEARVHDSAFHKSDRLVAWFVGETVLRWDAAKLCTDAGEGNVKRARQRLDQCLDFRGNTLFASVSACCVGCATWQRCFNLLPRMSLSLAMTSLFFVFVPWAFASFLSGGSSTSGQSIGGGGAKAIHVTCDVLGVLFAQAALVVQVHAVLRANEFLAKYRPMVPSLKPLFQPPKWRLVQHIMHAPWEQAI
ncbi:hypothetical protein CHLNCDRAFT_135651 [Chlorella variabilis]|uniref:Uncharacterized protein n=1 Tax=Chlorella variabilis TaxID=554065 RepID=E1ZIP0_CHLVA|nr:hypothetical protein CHLNCDRAFT_135651 [Chlorella variabilis]EFN54368.1 hypothetical protein CHLNCDRAFT_135651 [Chlorella variabilis]|eukprot:XP_005846470.1 hypothetical protein CHLNCDRAFT_135651 [Chlorella variabilis]